MRPCLQPQDRRADFGGPNPAVLARPEVRGLKIGRLGLTRETIIPGYSVKPILLSGKANRRHHQIRNNCLIGNYSRLFGQAPNTEGDLAENFIAVPFFHPKKATTSGG